MSKEKSGTKSPRELILDADQISHGDKSPTRMRSKRKAALNNPFIKSSSSFVSEQQHDESEWIKVKEEVYSEQEEDNSEKSKYVSDHLNTYTTG